VLLVVAATTATSIRPVFASELMSGRTKPKLHPALVLFYEQCVAVCFMAFFTLCAFNNLKDAIAFLGEKPGMGAFIILVGATTAFTYNLVTFYFTRAASALTVVITGNALKVVSIILSAFQESGYFDKWLHSVGLFVFILGLVAYAYCQHEAKKAKAAAAPKADVEKGGSGKPTEASPLNAPLVAGEADGNRCVVS